MTDKDALGAWWKSYYKPHMDVDWTQCEVVKRLHNSYCSFAELKINAQISQSAGYR
jgi:hypothetical protein